MPVSYDGSSLLKCSVSMTYVRYVVKNLPITYVLPPPPSPQEQALENAELRRLFPNF